MLALIASLLVSLLTGLALVFRLWPQSVPLRSHAPLAAALAVGFGLGLSTCIFFVWLLAFGPTRGVILVDLAVLGSLMATLPRAIALRRGEPSKRDATVAVRRPFERLLLLSSGVTVACALGAFAGLSWRAPHGRWDAWMTWNMRARFIFRGGDAWQDAFTGLPPHSHPDYPLLLHGLVVRGWVYAGHETTLAPIAIGLLFTFGTVALAVSALRTYRGTAQGLLAAMVLLGTPFLITHGASQYADVPVSFFFLATLVLLYLYDASGGRTHGFLVLAGAAAGLAAWTKNEGLLFLASLAVARAVVVWSAAGLRAFARQAAPFVAGLLPILFIVVYFKMHLAAATWVADAGTLDATIARALDVHRYVDIAREFKNRITTFGYNGLVSAFWLLVIYAACVGLAPREKAAPWIRTVGLTLVAMLIGHAAVFLTTTEDVQRLLNSSLERLLLQLWSTAVFAYFVIVRTPHEAATRFAGAVVPEPEVHRP